MTLREAVAKVLMGSDAKSSGELVYIGLEADSDPLEVRVVFGKDGGEVAINIFLDGDDNPVHTFEFAPRCHHTLYHQDIPY